MEGKKEKAKLRSKQWYKNNKEYANKRDKEYYEEHKNEILIRQKKDYQENKQKHKERKKKYYQANRERIILHMKKHHYVKSPLLKKEVLTYYGNGKLQCVCCGESDINFLSIDHINNDGAQHKKQIKYAGLYAWLKRKSFPKGFQTLCFNCNCGKRITKGVCPHNIQEIRLPIMVQWNSHEVI